MDKNKIFITQRRAIEGRYDPDMVLYRQKISNFNYNTQYLRQFLKSKPQYGSNQAGQKRLLEEQARYIRITDIDKYGRLKNNLGATAEKVESKYILNDNDLLFARSGATVGKAYLHKLKDVNYTCFYAGYMIRFIIDETQLLPDYVFCYTQLYVYKEWVDAIQRAAGQPNINAEEYKSLLIPIPPLKKQQEIVNLFQAAYQQKQQKEQEAKQLLDSIDDYLMEKLDIELPQSTQTKSFFYTRFGALQGKRFDPFYHKAEFEELEQALNKSIYPLDLLRNLLIFLESGSRPTGGVSNITNGILSLGGEHVNYRCEVEVKKAKYIPEKYHHQHMMTATKMGDILLVKDGATTGKIGIINTQTYVGQNINEHVFLMRFSEKVNNIFILNLLATSFYQSIISKIITGATVTGLTKSAIRGLKIPLPPLKVQNEIATHISALRSRAKALEKEGKQLLKSAKKEVEKMILGEE